MGFTDLSTNRIALNQSNGKIQIAIDLLVNPKLIRPLPCVISSVDVGQKIKNNTDAKINNPFDNPDEVIEFDPFSDDHKV
jgi:hypothetical protein